MAGDDYERAYLGGDEALHREKRVSRTTFGILMGVSGLMGVMGLLSLGAFATGDPQGLGGAALMGGVAAMNAFLGVALSVTRTVVTPRELRFMVGIRNRAIPLAAINGTSVHTLRPPALRADVAKDGAELSAIFGSGDYVRVAWTDETGKARVVWIGSDDARALESAIARARSLGTPRTRVAEIEDTSVEPDEEAAKAVGRTPVSRSEAP